MLVRDSLNSSVLQKLVEKPIMKIIDVFLSFFCRVFSWLRDKAVCKVLEWLDISSASSKGFFAARILTLTAFIVAVPLLIQYKENIGWVSVWLTSALDRIATWMDGFLLFSSEAAIGILTLSITSLTVAIPLLIQQKENLRRRYGARVLRVVGFEKKGSIVLLSGLAGLLSIAALFLGLIPSFRSNAVALAMFVLSSLNIVMVIKTFFSIQWFSDPIKILNWVIHETESLSHEKGPESKTEQSDTQRICDLIASAGDIMACEMRSENLEDLIKEPTERMFESFETALATCTDNDSGDQTSDDIYETLMMYSFPEKTCPVAHQYIVQLMRIYSLTMQSRGSVSRRTTESLLKNLTHSLVRIEVNEGLLFFVEKNLIEMGVSWVQKDERKGLQLVVEIFEELSSQDFAISNIYIFDRVLIPLFRFCVQQNISWGTDLIIKGVFHMAHSSRNSSGLLSGAYFRDQKFRLLNFRHQREILNTSQEVEKISNCSKNLEDLGKLQSAFSSCLDVLRQYDINTEPLREIFKEILENAKGNVILRRIKEIIFHMLAFLLYERQYETAREILRFEQPEDAAAIWTNVAVLPRTPESVLEFYLLHGLFLRPPQYWDERHGSKRYFDLAFAILLLKSLTNRGKHAIPKLTEVDACTLWDMSHSIGDYVAMASAICKDERLLKDLGFDLASARKTLFSEANKLSPFEKYLTDFSEQVEIELKRRESTFPLSEAKKERLNEVIHKSLCKSSALRRMVESNLVVENSESAGELTSSTIHFSYEPVESDRGAFIADWPSSIDYAFHDLGRQWSFKLNNYVLSGVSSFLERAENLDRLIEIGIRQKNNRKPVLFVTNSTVDLFSEVNGVEIVFEEIPYLLVEDNLVPVHSFYTRTDEVKVFVLYQDSPFYLSDNSEENDGLSITIIEHSEDPEIETDKVRIEAKCELDLSFPESFSGFFTRVESENLDLANK